MTMPQEVETLREALAEHAVSVQPQIRTTHQLRALTARFPAERRRARTQFAAAAVAAVAAVAAAVVAVLQLSPAQGRHRELPAGPVVLPIPAPTIADVALPSAQIGVTSFTFTAPGPDLVVGSVLWVDDMHENTVTRIDLQTMRVLGSRRYPPAWYATEGQMTAAQGVVLLPTDGRSGGGQALILRFDASTGRALAPIHVQRAGAIVSTPEGVVTKISDGKAGIVDPIAGTISRTFSLPVDRNLAYADGLVWGWNGMTSTLVGVDPKSGRTIRSMRLAGLSDVTMQADRDALILDDGDGLARLDLRTGSVTAATADTPLNLSRDRAGRLWGVVDGKHLVAFDPMSLRVVKSYRVRGLDLVHVSGNMLLATDRQTGRVRAFALSRLASG